MGRILIVDIDPECRSTASEFFKSAGHSTFEASDGKSAVAHTCSSPPDLIILNVDMPKRSSMWTVRTLHEEYPEIPIVVTASEAAENAAKEAIKRGAVGFITVPYSLSELESIVNLALEKKRISAENATLLSHLRSHYSSEGIVGSDPQLKKACSLAEKAFKDNQPVLILGERGSGKTRLAKTIHFMSDQAAEPFVRVDCGLKSESDLAIELFGHQKRGAAGLATRRIGAFEQAGDGTVLLDRLDNIDNHSLHTKLTQLLEEKQLRLPGGQKVVPIQARMIATATDNSSAYTSNASPLDQLSDIAGVVTIMLPPLRDRKSDIPALIDHFVKEYASEHDRSIAGMDEAAIALLMELSWEGNVRELKNCVERAVISCNCEWISPANITSGAASASATRKKNYLVALRDIERDHIKRVLVQCKWNQSAAAKVLQIDRKTLRGRIREFGFTIPDRNRR